MELTLNRISVLSGEVVDQIAAGEVVERPLHLVKELLENALDAGASELLVQYGQGGRFIAVEDNGIGIHPKDLALSLARHATSKIADADDLWSLKTFGFRGEALSAIASVSQLELTSRSKGSETAFSVTSSFGGLSPVTEAPGNFGTRVVVSRLFENLPARLKFMKSDSSEHSQIRQVVRALALANSHCAFELKEAGKHEADLSLPRGQSFLDRAALLLGVRLFLAEGEYEGVHVEAAFSSPSEVLRQSRQIWIFVQGRWVQDRSIQTAVLESYRSLLMHGEFPYVAIRIGVDPSKVDVNIHPTKSQVKFESPSSVFRAVTHVLRQAIERAPWRAPALPTESQMMTTTAITAATTTDAWEGAQGAAGMATGAASGTGTATDHNARVKEALENYSNANQKQSLRYQLSDFVRPYGAMSKQSPEIRTQNQRLAGQQIPLQGRASADLASRPIARYQDLVVIGQLNRTYIVCQSTDRMVLVDQHAAHERIAFERLMQVFRMQSGTIESQELLIPRLIELDTELIEALLASSSELERIGIGLEQMAPRTIAVQRVPTLLKPDVLDRSLEAFARGVVEHGASLFFETAIKDVFATMACHSVVRAGDVMEIVEMKELLKQMDEFPLSGYCPHGRPVSLDISFSQIERDFGRLGS